jgi:hypothetical protein
MSMSDARSDPLHPGREPTVAPYNVDRIREQVRTIVAVLAVTSAAAFTILIAVVAGWLNSQEAQGLAAVVMAPLFGLAGAAVVFYLSGSGTGQGQPRP